MCGFGATGSRGFLRVPTAPTAQALPPTSGPRRGPPLGRSFCRAGAGWAQKTGPQSSQEAHFFCFCFKVSAVLGHFPAKLGPETRSNGPGSTNGAERT